MKISEVTADLVDNKAKLDVIKQEEHAIKAEKAAVREATIKADMEKEKKAAIEADKIRLEEEMAEKQAEEQKRAEEMAQVNTSMVCVSLDIWSSNVELFTGPGHFLLD